MKRTLLAALVVALFASLAGCAHIRPETGARREQIQCTVSGYCKCGKCCNWKRNWFGRAVVASGPQKGKPKKVGITASGTKARPGVIAADTKHFPFGTVIYVPGFGYGRVEDKGRAIKEDRIDLFFASHGKALKWGKQTKTVTVWYPSPPRRASR